MLQIVLLKTLAHYKTPPLSHNDYLDQGSASKRVFSLLFALSVRCVVFFCCTANSKKFCFLLFFQGSKNRLLFEQSKKVCFCCFFNGSKLSPSLCKKYKQKDYISFSVLTKIYVRQFRNQFQSVYSKSILLQLRNPFLTRGDRESSLNYSFPRIVLIPQNESSWMKLSQQLPSYLLESLE